MTRLGTVDRCAVCGKLLVFAKVGPVGYGTWLHAQGVRRLVTFHAAVPVGGVVQ